jgi:hypothetical protein
MASSGAFSLGNLRESLTSAGFSAETENQPWRSRYQSTTRRGPLVRALPLLLRNIYALVVVDVVCSSSYLRLQRHHIRFALVKYTDLCPSSPDLYLVLVYVGTRLYLELSICQPSSTSIRLARSSISFSTLRKSALDSILHQSYSPSKSQYRRARAPVYLQRYRTRTPPYLICQHLSPKRNNSLSPPSQPILQTPNTNDVPLTRMALYKAK